jgi:capsular exopolysaccharide synthesis family protein
MSRIHEALKKAEQERTILEPEVGNAAAPPILPDATLHESALIAPGIPTGTATAAAQAPVSVIDGFRQTRWSPDPKAMLFFGGDDHQSGAEEFRTLRTRLYQAREKAQLSKLLITSPLPKEGKSFTAANLAQVIVRQHGKRALLIDADLRNPQLHTLLGAEPGPGVAEFLRSEIDERSIIQRGPMENLCLIPAGRASGNPAELVANGRIRLLTERLEPLFDWIIIDSAPAALVSDAGLLANYCDGVLLVVRSNATPVDAARRAAQEFPPEKLLGVVLNGIAPELSPYSRYYYSAYGQNGNKQVKN